MTSLESALRIQICNTFIGGKALIVTGNATEEAFESVKMALAWVRFYRPALLGVLGLDEPGGPSLADILGPGHQLHIHIAPAATPKTSICGGAISVALASLMARRPVVDNLVVVGEMGSQGQLYGQAGFELRSVSSTVEACGYQHMVVSESIWEIERDWLNDRDLRGLSIVKGQTLHQCIGSILGPPWRDEVVDETAV